MSEIQFDAWHRLSRGVPTYETVARQGDIERTAKIAKGKAGWTVALYDDDRMLREWPLPDAVEPAVAQKAAEILLRGWGIADVNAEAGAMSGFAWKNMERITVAMYMDNQTFANGMTVLNRMFPGRGTELGEAMLTVEKAAATPRDQASYDKILEASVNGGANLEKYRMVNTAMKIANAQKQAEITRLALADEGVEQSPYHILT